MKRIILLIMLTILLLLPQTAQAQKSFINGIVHGEYTLTVDLPGSQQFQNIGSKRDGAGMCVFSAIEMAGLACGLEQMRGWRNWCAEKYAGGGWPEKVDVTLRDWFAYKSIPPIPYIQYEGKDPAPFMDMCEKTRRPFGMTYGYSPRYGRSIQHMVTGVMFRDKYGVVLDNNFPGEDRYEWVERDEFVRRTIYPNRQAWLFCWLPPPPPLSPRNLPVK